MRLTPLESQMVLVGIAILSLIGAMLLTKAEAALDRRYNSKGRKR